MTERSLSAKPALVLPILPPADFYDYGRHTFASLVALAGAPAWRLCEVLGHVDIERTLQYLTLRDPPVVAHPPR